MIFYILFFRQVRPRHWFP